MAGVDWAKENNSELRKTQVFREVLKVAEMVADNEVESNSTN